MGGGDLNLKKSWAVNIQANQRKVWEAEKKALDERRRVQEVMKEREEERQIEELRRLQMEASGKSGLIDPKVAWMYQDQTGGVEKEASEAYLLGKRRVDQIILKQDSQKEESQKSEDPLASALSARDISSKAALDPLLAIEKQRTANLQALMADPIARRRLMKDMTRSKDKEDNRKERRHGRHRDDDRDGHHHSKRRYSDESDGDRRERRRYRDNSDDERRERRRYRDDSGVDRRERRRYRGDGEDDRREKRRRRDDDERERMRYRDDYDEDRQGHRARKDYRRLSRSRSRSPYRQRRQEQPAKDTNFSRTLSPDHKRDADAEERAAKLAAMSANANDLEDARNRRLAEMEARDAAEKVREDRRRDKRGDRFVNDLREQAESKGLGDRLQRASGGLARLESSI
jgi:hypothetical protein